MKYKTLNPHGHIVSPPLLKTKDPIVKDYKDFIVHKVDPLLMDVICLSMKLRNPFNGLRGTAYFYHRHATQTGASRSGFILVGAGGKVLSGFEAIRS